jgi:tetratricopeptide (TPR) repeat protein
VNIGRNDSCPCGSGRKYKQCCGRLGPQPNVIREAVNWVDAGAHIKRGDALARDGRLHEAIACYQQALSISADIAEAHFNMGNALIDLGRPAEAVACYARVLAIQPDSAEAHHNLGNAWRSQERLDQAIDCYRRALELQPDFAVAYASLGTALRLAGRGSEAEASFSYALELTPDSAKVCAELAELRADQGQIAPAEELYRRAILLDAKCTEAWVGLARLRKQSRDDRVWLTEAQLIVRSGLPPRKELLMRYAVGKAMDDIGEYQLAFSNYRRANELSKRHMIPYDRPRLTQLVDLIIQNQTADWLQRAAKNGVRSDRPVFILGMLRSGTTLAEQILASHSAVIGAGELPYWNAAIESSGLEVMAGGATDQPLADLARRYLESLPVGSSDTRRVIDKTPGNFLHLGLIHAALPEARFIHMRRHPVDTCLSIYFQHLETFHTYACDLDDLAHYYTQYRRLMQHWHTVLPAAVILEVPYEDLVADTESCSRRMLDFIGLPWDPHCLDFHRTERTILTASKSQVRRVIDNSAVGRWRAYQKFIDPLLGLIDSQRSDGM